MKNRHSIISIAAAASAVVMITSCAGGDQTTPTKNTPVQQTVPGTAVATAPAAIDSSATTIASTAAPIPTMMQAKPSPTATARPAPVKVPGAVPGEAIITVTGQVWDVAASARVIDLVESVHGINAVAVDDKTEITSVDGKRTGLNDVKPGMIIQASGQADGHGAVLASKVRIMTVASPLPAARPTPN